MRRLLVLSTCVVLAACGSSGPKRLTREQYATRANVVCVHFHRQLARLGKVVNLQQLDKVATATLPLLRDATRELANLRPPKEDDATVRRWLSSLDRLERDVAKLRDRARANDLAGVHRVANAAIDDDERSSRLARTVGATACARSR